VPLASLTVADVGERALVARIQARLAQPSWVIRGPGDDAAVIKPERGAFDVVTTDALVDGVHFDPRFVPYDAIGYRALSVNLSDLAAMGAKPRAVLLSLALPASLDVESFDRMVEGFVALADDHGVALVGGNITSTPGPLMLDVTAIGAARPRTVLTRDGARPGDDVYVTGRVGDASAGLQALRLASERGVPPAADAREAIERYLRPEPRVRIGVLLGRNRAASSCMDLSDGLADAIRQIADASGVGVRVDGSAVPVSPFVRRWHEECGRDPLEAAMCGGDDYELIFTVRPAHHGRFRGVRRLIGNLPITRIGVVTRSRQVVLEDARGVRELPAGYQHFQ
jgi:thiamine-monophosphate kinase